MLLNKHSIVAIFLLTTLLQLPVTHADECTPWVAMAISVQGDVERRVTSNDQQTWMPVNSGDKFCAKDVLRVRQNSRAALVLTNDTIVRLDENTTITFTNLSPDSASSMDLMEGIAHFISRVKQLFKVVTPFVNASIEGTEFVVTVAPDQAEVTVFEGVVRAENDKGQVVLKKGQTAVAMKDQAPVLKTLVKPRDAVQWALYYPTILQESDIDPKLPDEIRDTLARSMIMNTRGNASAAATVTDEIPNDIQDSSIYSYRASLRLAIGRVTKAKEDIERALSIKSNDSNALALKSIIAVVENRSTDAKALAKQAITSNPKNAAAYLALSYSAQAQFNLVAAQEALNDAPDNALINSRRAEIYLMQGDINNALDFAHKAVNKNIDSTHTQTVLGFAYLIMIDTTKARKYFNLAITLGQTNPLAHLGLGLALIREGELQNGRREIEYAASLDPNNSLIRSYLGKAYYEEGRNKVAADQFEMAKTLDPNDPTPWFYDSIRKQSENDASGAMEDLRNSISKNDNRAIYRSKLLLDQDQAVRNSSQAQIYRNLSFNELAITDASRSTAFAPDNSAAYRFLYESYIGNERYESAGVSNLLQAQLLQPQGLNPIQPQASELNLNTVIPIPTAFNEFTTLFDNENTKFNATIMGGNNNLLSDEMIVSGTLGRTSYSIGQFYYDTDGFREKANVRHRINNIGLKQTITNNFDFQFEYKDRDTEQGDLVQDFDRNQVPAEERMLDQEEFRLGGRVKFSPDSTFLMSAIDVNKSGDTRVYDDLLGVEINNNEEVDATDYQVRYIANASEYNWSFGGGSYNVRVHSIEQANFGGFLPPPTILNADVKQDSAYLYFNLFPSKSFEASIGYTYARMENSFLQDNYYKSSPKFGFIWKITDNFQFRAAAFKTFKRIQATNQTLEPTQIAGFNQIYDDFNASTAEVHGAGMDYEPNLKTKLGLNVVTRDISQPEPPGASIPNLERDEETYKIYYYQLLGSFALSTEAIYEKFTNPVVNPLSLKSHKVPVNIHYSLNRHFYTDLTLTYVEQDIVFSPAYSSVPDDTESFGLVDLAFGYRFTQWKGSISIDMKNILDEEFVYQDYSLFSSDPFTAESRILPSRTIIGKILLYF